MGWQIKTDQCFLTDGTTRHLASSGAVIYLCDLATHHSFITALLAEHFNMLSPAEKRYFYSISLPHRQRNYAVGRIILKILLAKLLEVSPAEILFNISSSGKPVLAESTSYEASAISFNLSHSRDCLALGICRSGNLGIDIEYSGAGRKTHAILQRFFHLEEQKAYQKLESTAAKKQFFFSLWTLKEALLKMTGHGISYGLNKFALQLDILQQSINLLPPLPQTINTNPLYGATYIYRNNNKNALCQPGAGQDDANTSACKGAYGLEKSDCIEPVHKNNHEDYYLSVFIQPGKHPELKERESEVSRSEEEPPDETKIKIWDYPSFKPVSLQAILGYLNPAT